MLEVVLALNVWLNLLLQEGGEVPDLTVGSVVEGVIEESDREVTTETLAAEYTDAPVRGKTYRLRVSEPGPCFIELRSYFFDAYLVLRNEDGEVLAEDDDGLLATHSRALLDEVLPEVVITVEACALHGGGGAFTLSAFRGRPPALLLAERRDLVLADSRRTLAIREEVLGPKHPSTATSLNSLALLLKSQGNYEEARPLFESALAISEEVLGPRHPHTARSLNNLALLLESQGNYEEARPLFERALAIQEEVLGPKHSDTATSLSNLALLLESQGNYEEARPLFERALAISEEVLGPKHPDTATSLNNLAALLWSQGNYVEARPLYERALATHEEVLGPKHPHTAASLNNLALLLKSQGNYEEARPLYERALATREEVLGPKHPDTATSLNNLAALLESQGNYEEARPPYERALAIREEVLGPKHPDTARSLNSLALLLWSQGNCEKARLLYERALATREEVLGPKHPDTAASLNNLAGLLEAQGNYEEARPLYERALAISTEVLGPKHPHTAASLNNLAELVGAEGDWSKALRLSLRSVEFRRDILVRQLSSLSDRERLLLASQHRRGIDQSLSFASKVAQAADWSLVYGGVLSWKGSVARGLAEERRWLRQRANPEMLRLIEQLHHVEECLSGSFWSEGKSETSSPAQLKKLAAERDRLERELSQLKPEGLLAPQVELSKIQNFLPEDAALLDLVFYWNHVERDHRLIAFIVRKDSPLVASDLGPADGMHEALNRHLAQVRGQRGVSAIEEAGSEESLCAILWDPLAPHLDGVRRIFVCPDGELATLPFETLPGEKEGTYLLERFSFIYLQSVTELVHTSDRAPAEGLLAAGGLNYGQVESDVESSEEVAQAKSERPEAGSGQSFDPLRSLQRPFPPLPSALGEVQDLANLYRNFHGTEAKVELLTGAAASETRVKQALANKRYVHLATHGFFAPEEVKSKFDAAMELVERDDFGVLQRLTPPQLTGWMPGQLSGVVLSGADRESAPADNDGILTSAEIAWLDLSGCELVVLSACETGLGLPMAGEHLLGLRRALHLAGARATVTSLWKVNDADTQWLMSQFYRRLWKDRMPKGEALRAAQLAQLERNRALHGAALPGTWGAFVLEGDWR